PIPHTSFSIHPAEIVLSNHDGSPAHIAPHHILAIDKVRFNGEPVAFVIATSVNIAKDAAELVSVEYEPLDAIVGSHAAVAERAPRIWDDAKSNICVDAIVGDQAATDAVFAQAKCVVKLDTWVNRVTGVPMEPRAAVGSYDPN